MQYVTLLYFIDLHHKLSELYHIQSEVAPNCIFLLFFSLLKYGYNTHQKIYASLIKYIYITGLNNFGNMVEY